MANTGRNIYYCRLDGRESVTIPLEFRYNDRLLTEDIKIIVRGFLKFEEGGQDYVAQFLLGNLDTYQNNSANKLNDKTVVYPVLFQSDEITIHNGEGTVTLLPRAEDILHDFSTLRGRIEAVQSSNSISDEDIINLSINGIKEDEQLVDLKLDPSTIIIETGHVRTPYKISVEITVVDDTYYGQTLDVSQATQESQIDDPIFINNRIQQGINKIIIFYNDEDWIPAIESLLTANAGTTEEAITALDELEYIIPFGSSAMYDAIVTSSEILSNNDIDGIRKLIYVFTDNFANLSTATVDSTIESVNAIDGNKQVPVLIGNLATTEPITMSIKATASDTRDLNKLALLTGGQSVTVIDETQLDEVTNIFYGQATGALGYGTFEFTIDLGEIVAINSISPHFDIPDERANANWQVVFSEDGYNFATSIQTYAYNESETYSDTNARYLRFKIILITGFSSQIDEYVSKAESPALQSITLIYNKEKTLYLFVNSTEEDNYPFHIAVAVDANNDVILDEQIKVGFAPSDSHNWSDFHTESQSYLKQNGKIVVPLRFSQNVTKFPQEKLFMVDRFTLKTSYGKLDPSANVFIYNKENEVVSSANYKVYPREGYVVFNYILDYNYIDGDYKIGILNQNIYKIGLQLSNKSRSNSLEIYGIGYNYSTNKDLLPPLAKAVPSASNVVVSPLSPGIYNTISLNYNYYDANYDEENKLDTIIKWYINGVRQEYLDNLRVWNDITNHSDPLYQRALLPIPADKTTSDEIQQWARENHKSILEVGDSVYCIIQVTDGNLFSQKYTSNAITIVEYAPIASNVKVWGNDINGTLLERATGQFPVVLTFDFFADTTVNRSEIVWYVNESEFKRGFFGDQNINKLLPADVGTNTVDYALKLYNSVYATVTPISSSAIGDKVTSNTIIIENSIPYVRNVQFLKNSFSFRDDIVISWVFYDFEVLALDFEDQSDESTIKWYKKEPGQNNFTLYAQIKDPSEAPDGITFNKRADGVNSCIIASRLLGAGQQWYATIQPNDGLDDGILYTTQTIIIVKV